MEIKNKNIIWTCVCIGMLIVGFILGQYDFLGVKPTEPTKPDIVKTDCYGCKCGCKESGKCECGANCPCLCGCGTSGKCQCSKFNK